MARNSPIICLFTRWCNYPSLRFSRWIQVRFDSWMATRIQADKYIAQPCTLKAIVAEDAGML